MQYLLLIYGNENHFDKMSQAEQNKILQEYMEFSNSFAATTWSKPRTSKRLWHWPRGFLRRGGVRSKFGPSSRMKCPASLMKAGRPRPAGRARGPSSIIHL